MTYHGSPGSGKAQNEERGENDEHDAGADSSLRVLTIQAEVTDGSKDQEADKHPARADHQRLASTVVFNNVETNEGGSKVNGVQNDLRDEGVDVH